MFRRLLALLILLAPFSLIAYAVLFPSSKASPKELVVVSRTKGQEVVRAEVVNDEVKFSFKNNHKQTVTAYALAFGSLNITEDFAYSEVNQGIAPGETFERTYPLSESEFGSQPPSLVLLTVLLEGGNSDGDTKTARKIRDKRQGEKVQLHRALKLLEKHSNLPKDLKALKKEVETLLDVDEDRALATLNELQPGSPKRTGVSDELTHGLIDGRAKMIQRIEELDEYPDDHKETAFTRLKTFSKQILTRL